MCAKTIKTVLAGLIVTGALVVGIPMMISSEANTDLKVETVDEVTRFYDIPVNEIMNIPEVAQMINQGLTPYFIGIGLIFLAVAAAVILADGHEHITTLTGRDTDEAY